jgi:predicted RNA-binding Zn-ribbon protein involved in translation (DUF1610 family)
MQTHNASIYHCVSCGRIMHAELESAPLSCCGQTMVEVRETIQEGETQGIIIRSDQERNQQKLDTCLKELDIETASLLRQGAERHGESQ